MSLLLGSFEICIITPKIHARAVKNALEHHNSYRTSSKIIAVQSEAHLLDYVIECGFQFRDKLCIIPTTLSLDFTHDAEGQQFVKDAAGKYAVELGLETLRSDISFAARTPRTDATGCHVTELNSRKRGVLAQTVQRWLTQLPLSLQSSLPLSIAELVSLGSWTYTIYPPLLLLPATSFNSDPWPTLLSGLLAPHVHTLYGLICEKLHVSHLATNAPIPLLDVASGGGENKLRSPTSFTPLHGDFGRAEEPSAEAFKTAFWASTRQHGIYQTWAPLHTMFSRGNISEKARILHMPELSLEMLGCEPAECSAVDLYAGIGYFVFCFAKAGIRKVLCWEINAWSVEGLRRGAGKNRWAVRVVDSKAPGTIGEDREETLVVFQEDNQNARIQIEKMRDRIPPVRHVNCGFLPSSSASWPVAVAVLDRFQGGWVHAHENIAVNDIESRKTDIINIFARLANPGSTVPQRSVQCQHLERVKSYAPGIMHCVLDIYIGPHTLNEDSQTPTLAMPTLSR